MTGVQTCALPICFPVTIWVVTELPDEKIKGVHVKPYKDLKKAVADALAEKGEDAKIIVLPYGSMIVPKVE